MKKSLCLLFLLATFLVVTTSCVTTNSVSTKKAKPPAPLSIMLPLDSLIIKGQKKLEGRKDYVNTMAFSKDGQYLAEGGKDGTVTIWNVESRKKIKVFKSGIAIETIAFFTDRKYVVWGNSKGHLILWGFASKNQPKILSKNKKISKVREESEGETFSRLYSKYIQSKYSSAKYARRRAERNSKSKHYRKNKRVTLSNPVKSVSFSPDGRHMVSANRSGTIILWNLSPVKKIKIIKGHSDSVNTVKFSPNGKYLASGSSDNRIILWDTTSWKSISTFRDYLNPIFSLSFSPDSKRLAAGSAKSKTIDIWEIKSGKKVGLLEEKSDYFTSLSFNKDGRYLVSGTNNKKIIIWDTYKEEKVKVIKGHKDMVTSVAFNPEKDFIVSSGQDKTVVFWEIEPFINIVNSVDDLSAKKNLEISNLFKQKNQFESKELYKDRIKRDELEKKEILRKYQNLVNQKKLKLLPLIGDVNLLHYNVKKNGYNIRFKNKLLFVEVPVDIAKEMKLRENNVFVEAELRYHNLLEAELLNAYLVDGESGQKFPFGKHEGGTVITASSKEKKKGDTVAAIPQLEYDVKVEDANGNGILEGGEKVTIKVDVRNVGNATAYGVRVKLSGDKKILAIFGKSKPIGAILSNRMAAVQFESIIPPAVAAGNRKFKVVLEESRGYSPLTVKTLQVAVKPAELSEEVNIVSSLEDVDILLKKHKGSPCINCYAVVIGISRYRNSDKIPTVKYAEKDAETIARYFEVVAGIPSNQIKILKGETASKADIESAIEEWLPRRVKRSSRVFVYYAGHGTPDPESNEAYLVPYEGEPGYTKKLYPLKKLYSSLNKLKAKEMLVMLDSCFSGSGGRSVAAAGTRPIMLSVKNPVLSGGKVLVMTASKGSELSSDFDKTEHGLFTYYLLRGLRGEADSDKDGSVKVKELYQFVRSGVSKTAANVLDRDQNPDFLPGLKMLKGDGFAVTRIR